MSAVINIYAQILKEALPIAVVFGFGNLITTAFLNMAFRGKIVLGG